MQISNNRPQLIILSLVLIAALWRWVPLVLDQITADSGPRAHGPIDPLPSRQVAIVDISALDLSIHHDPSGRDIFRLGPLPEAVTTTPEPQPPDGPVLGDKKQERKKVKTQAPPPITVNLIGIFGPEHRRVAAFKNKNNATISNALVGQVIENRFRAVEITSDSVTLEHLGHPEISPTRLQIGS